MLNVINPFIAQYKFLFIFGHMIFILFVHNQKWAVVTKC